MCLRPPGLGKGEKRTDAFSLLLNGPMCSEILEMKKMFYRFFSLQGLTQNLFRLGRHLMQAVNHRIVRAQAFQVWKEAVCA